ncbi:DUF3089 domain-containing protein [Phenylobacterium montanum]|uniref:DUF3089 domain-containing protein n=1 Tax=Phenylobacterium montanum TaxID=2823693 RepID=A0A975FYF9_9CAUL|nr:DUF3089 domain-containing protein [Caulobacter sp. S6]QUD86606.1 DUF3089 domain-containing protein [Caulobacter sp. S6]
MRKSLSAALALVAVLAASGLFAQRLHAEGGLMRGPSEPFAAQPPPPAPDYRRPEAWAARPDAPGETALTPDETGLKPAGRAAKVDVFFIHPTTYLAGEHWNAAYDEPGTPSTRIETGVMRYQASVFNGCCRIYAPHYRQAVLGAFMRDTPDGEAAIDLAYADVLRAFDDYMAHDNGGRPFIIAGHSQGSLHALRLLQERIIGTPLQKRLVAAYVIGGFVPAEIEAKGLPICRTERQTGCIVDWNSVAAGKGKTRSGGAALMWLDGRYQSAAGHDIVCVNPLDWRYGGEAPADANQGAIPAVHGLSGLPAPVAGLTGARCSDGMLEVDIPFGRREGFRDPLTLVGVYHDLDYNLFYMNLRRNAVERAEAFVGR